jgi:hypothetical protein
MVMHHHVMVVVHHHVVMMMHHHVVMVMHGEGRDRGESDGERHDGRGDDGFQQGKPPIIVVRDSPRTCPGFERPFLNGG